MSGLFFWNAAKRVRSQAYLKADTGRLSAVKSLPETAPPSSFTMAIVIFHKLASPMRPRRRVIGSYKDKGVSNNPHNQSTPKEQHPYRAIKQQSKGKEKKNDQHDQSADRKRILQAWRKWGRSIVLLFKPLVRFSRRREVFRLFQDFFDLLLKPFRHNQLPNFMSVLPSHLSNHTWKQ